MGSEPKAGWPMTAQFLEGLTSAATRTTSVLLTLRERVLDAAEAAIVAQEAALIAHAKIQYAHQVGARPTYWELYTWARNTGKPNLAAFLYANRRNPRITGLFSPHPPSPEPPEERP